MEDPRDRANDPGEWTTDWRAVDMAKPTAHRATEARHPALEGVDPPDILTMRTTAARALTEVLSGDELETVAETLRGHIRVLIPEVEFAAGRQPRESTLAICARAAAGEARRKLGLGGSDILAVHVSVTQKLARSVVAMCDHYERLSHR